VKCQNPECSKEVLEGKKYCNQDCLKRHLEIKKETKSNGALRIGGSDLTAQLMDSCFQRGLSWRGAKIEAIQTALEQGYSEEWILKTLMRGGLTRMTALRLITDCRYIHGGDIDE
jgi:hypothetical protein